MSIKESVTLDETIELLNSLVEIDPHAMTKLISARVECNEKLADHPTVQVGAIDDKTEVGILGVLNGIFGADEDGWGPIQVVMDVEKRVTKKSGTNTDYIITEFRRTKRFPGVKE